MVKLYKKEQFRPKKTEVIETLSFIPRFSHTEKATLKTIKYNLK